jgi:hypothetical protein
MIPVMTRRKSYQTAAARRKADPYIFDIDGVDIECVPAVDLVDLAPLVESLQNEIEDDENEKGGLSRSAERIVTLRKVVAQFVVPDCQDAFAVAVKAMAPPELSELIRDLLAEYTGAENPTQPALSSEASLTDGNALTAGALPTVLTPSV